MQNGQIIDCDGHLVERAGSPTSSRVSPPWRGARLGFARDSPLEGDGFELPVPRDKASVPRFRFGPPSVISTDGSRRSSSDGGMQPKPAIIGLARPCMARLR